MGTDNRQGVAQHSLGLVACISAKTSHFVPIAHARTGTVAAPSWSSRANPRPDWEGCRAGPQLVARRGTQLPNLKVKKTFKFVGDAEAQPSALLVTSSTSAAQKEIANLSAGARGVRALADGFPTAMVVRTGGWSPEEDALLTRCAAQGLSGLLRPAAAAAVRRVGAGHGPRAPPDLPRPFHSARSCLLAPLRRLRAHQEARQGRRQARQRLATNNPRGRYLDVIGAAGNGVEGSSAAACTAMPVLRQQPPRGRVGLWYCLQGAGF